MPYGKNRSGALKGGLTLTEMVIALAIAAIVFSVVLPQLRAIQNSWDSRSGAMETLQNGRVLMDHLYRHLSEAVRIKKVSGPSETNGYIEFQVSDGNNMRYDVGAGNYVEFGIAGSLSDLAGPVSRLQFTCYDAFDLTGPITDVNSIRCVKVQATLTNSARLDEDMTFTTQVYIRTNSLPAAGGGISKKSEPWLEFDTLAGMEPALSQMSGTKYLCAYRGDGDDGWACILTTNTGDWSVSATGFLEYDTKQGITPCLAKIDDTHVLCAYQGDKGDGWACAFTYTAPGTLSVGPPKEFDTADCTYPALSQIDSSHYLCTYGLELSAAVRAVVLTVDTGTWFISQGTTTEFVSDSYAKPGLAKIDDTHYLCVHTGPSPGFQGRAVVLTVNTADWTITTEAPCDFLAEYTREPTLARIDQTHYLCAYRDLNFNSYAAVLTVNTSNWTVTKQPASSLYLEANTASQHALCQIDNTNFLCTYSGNNNMGHAVVLTVDVGSWSLSTKPAFEFDSVRCLTPALCQVDARRYLCTYSGLSSEGYAGVLELRGGILP
jgi:prepilin-type N-terminal cleavage/methylation domain-containing protein